MEGLHLRTLRANLRSDKAEMRSRQPVQDATRSLQSSKINDQLLGEDHIEQGKNKDKTKKKSASPTKLTINLGPDWDPTIHPQTSETDESYQLDIDESSMTLTAAHYVGMVHGLETFS